MAGFCYPHPSFCPKWLKNSKVKVSANYFRVNKLQKEDPRLGEVLFWNQRV